VNRHDELRLRADCFALVWELGTTALPVPCPWCKSARATHRRSCPIGRALGLRERLRGVLFQAPAVLEPSASKPLPDCSWCGKPASATDESGDPACAKCAAPAAEAAE